MRPAIATLAAIAADRRTLLYPQTHAHTYREYDQRNPRINIDEVHRSQKKKTSNGGK